MRLKFVRNLIAGLPLLFSYTTQSQAETLEKFFAGAEIVGTGLCRVKEQTYVCDRIKKDEKDYLVFYNKEGEPLLAIRREDNKVVWVAGTDA